MIKRQPDYRELSRIAGHLAKIGESQRRLGEHLLQQSRRLQNALGETPSSPTPGSARRETMGKIRSELQLCYLLSERLLRLTDLLLTMTDNPADE